MKDYLTLIREQIESAIEVAKYRGERTACCTYNTDDGYIDIWCDDNDNAEVVVCHDDGRVREHPRLDDAIYGVLPEWEDVEIDTEEPYSDWVRFYGRI